MSWIEKIRQKPYEEKIRLVWVTVILSGLALIALWIVTAKFGKDTPKDTSLFETFGKGIEKIINRYKKQ